MPIDPETEKAVQRVLALLSEHYDMAGAVVFGSRARGTHARTAMRMSQ